MICNETMLLLSMVLLLLVIMFYRMHQMKATQEGFEEEGENTSTTDNQSTLQNLVAQYNNLSDDEKAVLAQQIGSPLKTSDSILKSAIPPEKECPTIDMTEYVKRSSIPPCPEPVPCVAPKVVVDANLCKTQQCEECPEVETTIKTERVPVFITKVVTVDEDGTVLSEEVQQSTDGDFDLLTNFLNNPDENTPTTTEATTTTTEATTTTTAEGFMNTLPTGNEKTYETFANCKFTK